jgi:hypothetical protein
VEQGKWIKAMRSSSSGDCVGVFDAIEEVRVRDSKNPEGGTLVFGEATFRAFIGDVRAGRFDLAD